MNKRATLLLSEGLAMRAMYTAEIGFANVTDLRSRRKPGRKKTIQAGVKPKPEPHVTLWTALKWREENPNFS